MLVGVTHDDTEVDAAKLADKVANLRVFDDADGVMNRSLLDTGGAALVVSQFTLYGDTTPRPPSGLVRGRRRPRSPSRSSTTFAHALDELGVPVATGRFRADMQVALVNDGPVTLLLEA